MEVVSKKLALPVMLLMGKSESVIHITDKDLTMSRFQKASHVLWCCQYHIVWTPKYCSGQAILATVSQSVPSRGEPAFTAQKYVAVQEMFGSSFARSSTPYFLILQPKFAKTSKRLVYRPKSFLLSLQISVRCVYIQ